MGRQGLRFAILGPGGVGGFLAAILARSENSVLVLAGDDTARSIAREGLRLESERFGNFEISVPVADRLSSPVDACLIAVKATHLKDALERVPAGVLGEGLVVPFLNGLEHVDLLRAVYPPSSVASATIRIESARVRAGLIHQTSPFATVELAASPANRDGVDSVAAAFGDAGLDVRVRDDELAMLWDKFAFLAPVALLTTHERANVGVIRTKRREDATALIDEVAALGRADGVAIDPEAILRQLDSMPGWMETSMQRDQAAGRQLELDALGGTLLRRAARTNIPVPVARRLVGELEARTAGSTPRAGRA